MNSQANRLLRESLQRAIAQHARLERRLNDRRSEQQRRRQGQSAAAAGLAERRPT